MGVVSRLLFAFVCIVGCFRNDSETRGAVKGWIVSCYTMNRPLSSFALCSVHKAKLTKAGYEIAEHLDNVSAKDLSEEIGVQLSEATEILRLVHEYMTEIKQATTENVTVGLEVRLGGTSAFDLLKKEETAKTIVTFSRHMDEMLEGGVPVGKITEICGSPGTGKTQLCIQLVVDSTIPSLFGGPGGEAIYIDTEGNFVMERVAEIAGAAVAHIQSVAESSKDAGMVREADFFTLESVLSKIHYYRCHSHLQLIALANILKQLVVSEHPKVCLVVVDSVASPFRHGFRDLSLRNRLLSGLTQSFIELATEFSLAVVLTNHMTTRSDSSVSNDGSHLVPALGESWGHAATIRIKLFWEGDQRSAVLFKSPCSKEAVARFQITRDGIRDIPPEESSSTHFPTVPSQLVQDESSYYEEEVEEHEDLDSLFQDALAFLPDCDEPWKELPVSKRPRTAEP